MNNLLVFLLQKTKQEINHRNAVSVSIFQQLNVSG